jgi:hypothetical protein
MGHRPLSMVFVPAIIIFYVLLYVVTSMFTTDGSPILEVLHPMLIYVKRR